MMDNGWKTVEKQLRKMFTEIFFPHSCKENTFIKLSNSKKN